MLSAPESRLLSASARATHAIVGAVVAATASFVVTWVVFHPDLSGMAAVGGFFVGVLGGALARAETHQVAITAMVWGALLGPVVGFMLLAVLIAIAGVGM